MRRCRSICTAQVADEVEGMRQRVAEMISRKEAWAWVRTVTESPAEMPAESEDTIKEHYQVIK